MRPDIHASVVTNTYVRQGVGDLVVCICKPCKRSIYSRGRLCRAVCGDSRFRDRPVKIADFEGAFKVKKGVQFLIGRADVKIAETIAAVGAERAPRCRRWDEKRAHFRSLLAREGADFFRASKQIIPLRSIARFKCICWAYRGRLFGLRCGRWFDHGRVSYRPKNSI